MFQFLTDVLTDCIDFPSSSRYQANTMCNDIHLCSSSHHISCTRFLLSIFLTFLPYRANGERGVELEFRWKFVINYHLESDRRAYMCGLMYTMFDIQLTKPFLPCEISLSSEQELWSYSLNQQRIALLEFIVVSLARVSFSLELFARSL